MVYHILLLHEMLDEPCKLKDYLQLSGYDVMEGGLNRLAEYEKPIQKADVILLYCEQVRSYFVLCEKIRLQTQIPIIILSKEDGEWEKIKMFQSGADDYLVEPFKQGEIIARVQAHIARYRRLTRPFGYIRVRGLCIEVLSRRVLLDNEEVFFTAREFDVLLYLAQHADEVVSKQDLYIAVWEDQLGDGYYNSVSAYIKKIRKKIERDPENPQYIETIWGIGYRFRT